VRPDLTWVTSLRSWIYIFISLTLGLGSGIFSAYYVIRQGVRYPEFTIGPWQSFRETDINEENPYALAHTAGYGNLKLATFEALYFIARKDDKNRILSGNCEYVIKGKFADARWWSITIYNQRGRLIDNPADRYSFNNTNLLPGKEAGYRIVLAANARAGNWIPLNADQTFIIMLRLYVPGISSIRDANEIAFPEIERVECS